MFYFNTRHVQEKHDTLLTPKCNQYIIMHKNILEHTINTRVLTTYKSIEDELKRDLKKNYLFDLSYLTVLDVIGDNAMDFLQGQLTCDMRLVNDVSMISGIQCNLQGRILAFLDCIYWNNYKLILPADLAQQTLASLNKTAQLSKVHIKNNTELKVFGLLVQNNQDFIPDNTFLPHILHGQARQSSYCYYHLGNGFYIFIIQKDIEKTFCAIFQNHDQCLGSLTWHTLRLYEKYCDIYPESRGLFLPHRLGLHQTDYISFNKGCYKGQEIIARTHYRATIKHELKIMEVDCKSSIFSGQKLFAMDTDVEIGELIDYSLLDNNRYLIAITILKDAPPIARFEGQKLPITLQDPHFSHSI